MKAIPTVLVLVALAIPAMGAGMKLEKPKMGDFWYRMDDPEGNPQGYAWFNITPTNEGGMKLSWELKLSFPGGTYEEEREMVLTSRNVMSQASHTAGGQLVSEGRLEKSGRFVGRARTDGELEAVDMELPADAACGLLFVFAAMLPREEGTVWARTSVNEAQGFRITGAEVFVRAGEDDGLTLYELRKAEGTTLPIWVNASREIVKVDWGGGNLMTLSRESTRHLFKPQAPAVTEVKSEKNRLVMEGTFAGFTPERLYDHLTKPELLVTWWPQKAEVKLEKGGIYHLEWPDQKWFLRGEILDLEPGKRLVFSWKWDHEPAETAVRKVEVALTAAEGGGTKLLLTHSPYDESEKDQKARAGHKAGWEHFLSRLALLGG